MANSNDKFYIIIILGMIGFFIYWYQTKLNITESCSKCKYKESKEKNHTRKKHIEKKKKLNKVVSFKIDADKKKKETDTDISSLESLDSSDHLASKESDIDTLDI